MSLFENPVLTGEKALLRPFTEDDAPVMARILAEPDVVRLTGSPAESFGLHRVSLSVFTHNPRARRTYEKVGFVAEGIERQTLWQGGEWIDALRMSILAPEWAAHRGRLERERVSSTVR
ncbi:GNAT family N-acetyltransferase [Streptomyces scabiei]|uniref:GNAT family N-acetyltransferase n=1 Tax=Streptomyces scabiei TaxID=1930 RepID=UPI0036E319DE